MLAFWVLEDLYIKSIPNIQLFIVKEPMFSLPENTTQPSSRVSKLGRSVFTHKSNSVPESSIISSVSKAWSPITILFNFGKSIRKAWLIMNYLLPQNCSTKNYLNQHPLSPLPRSPNSEVLSTQTLHYNNRKHKIQYRLILI